MGTGTIITIDGCAGSGKTSAARQLAEALGYELLRTGEMYRAVGLLLHEEGFDLTALASTNTPTPEVLARLAELHFDHPPGQIWLNGIDYTQRVQEPQSSALASLAAKISAVRESLKAEQRRLATGKQMVCEGRDQGTAVFPQASVKFYFHAHVRIRAARRAAQLQANGYSADVAVIEQELLARDRQDTERSADPLRVASDAYCIDTSHSNPKEVLAWLLERVKECQK